jgi:transcriptional regulator with XRE-family HTH domain
VKIQKRFGQIVQERRKAAGISQESLADKAGLHRTYISLLERGLRMPSLGVLKSLAKAFGTTMVDLIGELETTG